MKKIYASNMFNKKEIIDWENKPIVIKVDCNKAKLYFEQLVKDFEAYMQNSGSMSAKQGYKSANMAADVGNKLTTQVHSRECKRGCSGQ
jgi:hypothetical protein